MCEAGSVAFGDPAVSKTATVLGVSMLCSGRPVLMKSSHQVVKLWRAAGRTGEPWGASSRVWPWAPGKGGPEEPRRTKAKEPPLPGRVCIRSLRLTRQSVPRKLTVYKGNREMTKCSQVSQKQCRASLLTGGIEWSVPSRERKPASWQ